jgi:hypothetical protein
MPFKPGQSGNPEGRPKGSKNKNTIEAIEILEKKGMNPLEVMADMAMDENVSESVRARLLCELASYIYPKRKAVEISGPDDEALTVKILKIPTKKK